ncbi:hypothetical protein [Ornithinimicrobium tianjinense]|uniref:DUF222 domain-containing protein n=1 Tax=Ornithinimicrobium tianjinense TaxID=1195761 RepID=A0A917BDL2_9MICO|nr:hypothetical protein [Ornithinimicrobium tianjinense]GGF38884.1 hypothetical protein GCM10011366_03090 [Ornithinimicrobium tianjinense]
MAEIGTGEGMPGESERFEQSERSVTDASSGARWPGESQVDETVLTLRGVAARRAVEDAELISAAAAVLARVRDGVIDKRGLVGVELTTTQRATVDSAARSLAAAELEIAAGFGVGESRTLIRAASAPSELARQVDAALRRGEASWPLVRAFFDSTASLSADQRLLVAGSLFGDQASQAVGDRLDPDGELHGRPWGHSSFTAALEAEVTAARAADPDDERRRRERAYQRRRVTVRVHDDGTATLRLTGPAASVVAGGQRLDRAARTLRREGDARTLDQLRADTAQVLLMYGTFPLPSTSSSTITSTSASAATSDAPPADGTDVQSASGTNAQAAAGHRDGAPAPEPEPTPAPEPAPTPESEASPDGRVTSSGFDDILAPEDVDQLIRVLNALPTVTLQVVVPYSALAGGFPVCVRCGHATHRPSDHPPPTETLPDDSPPEDGSPCRIPPDEGPPAGTPPDEGARPPRRGRVGQVMGPHPFFVTDNHVRELALFPGTTLHRLVTDPLDGRLIERTIASYRPDTDMRRQVIAADQLNRAPGPRLGAHGGELDHVTPYGWAGGPTGELNLALLAKRPHRFKTEGMWHLSLGARRDLTVTTLLGQMVTTRTFDYRTYLRGAEPAGRRDRANRLVYAALAEHPANRYRARSGETCIRLTGTSDDGQIHEGPTSGHPTLIDLLGLTDDPPGDAA